MRTIRGTIHTHTLGHTLTTLNIIKTTEAAEVVKGAPRGQGNTQRQTRERAEADKGARRGRQGSAQRYSQRITQRQIRGQWEADRGGLSLVATASCNNKFKDTNTYLNDSFVYSAQETKQSLTSSQASEWRRCYVLMKEGLTGCTRKTNWPLKRTAIFLWRNRVCLVV